jgi:hypothetical protein
LLPHDDRVTYITVGRDPRDAAVSMNHHMDNMNLENFIMERAAAVGLDDLIGMEPPDLSAPTLSDADRFWHWVETEDDIRAEGLASLVERLQGFWERRHEPNIVVLHYSDLQRDLVGQMQYLAGRLGLERSRARLEELAPYASFDAMKASAPTTAPNADQTFWRDTTEFFHRGTSGQWRDVIGEEELPRYEKRLHELVDAEFAHWLEHGTLG